MKNNLHSFTDYPLFWYPDDHTFVSMAILYNIYGFCLYANILYRLFDRFFNVAYTSSASAVAYNRHACSRWQIMCQSGVYVLTRGINRIKNPTEYWKY